MRIQNTFARTGLFTAILAGQLLVGLPAFAGNLCQAIFESGPLMPVGLATAQLAWRSNSFSDPRACSPQNFRYIVHAAPRFAGTPISPKTFLEFIEHNDWNQRDLYSGSVISNQHTSTFNRYGVILSVPPEKIIAASSKNMWSDVGDKHGDKIQPKIQQLYEINKLDSPQKILDANVPGEEFYDGDLSWTEVVIYGKAKSSHSIRVTGLFAQVDSLGIPILSHADRDILEAYVGKMHLPLVPLSPLPGHFVLAVSMTGGRAPSVSNDFSYNFGPEHIQFLSPETEVRRIVDEASRAHQSVLLVDIKFGPHAYAIDPSFFSGYSYAIPYSKDTTQTVLKFKNEELPQGVGPIQFQFLEATETAKGGNQ